MIPSLVQQVDQSETIAFVLNSVTWSATSSGGGIFYYPIEVRSGIENRPQAPDNMSDMLAQINALPNVKLHGDEVAVRPLAIQAAEGVVFASLAFGNLPIASEISGDGMGGIEISWREGQRELLLSIAASRQDLPPDIYLMLVDRSETERSKRFRTIREEIPSALVEHISWLKTPVVIPTPQS